MMTTESNLRRDFAALSERRERLLRRRSAVKQYINDAMKTQAGQRHAPAHRSELDDIQRELGRVDDEMAALVQRIKAETVST